MQKVYRKTAVAFWDLILVNLAFLLAYVIQTQGQLPIQDFAANLHVLLVVSVLKLFIFNAFQLYSSIWEYASIEELIKVVGAVVVANLIAIGYLAITPVNMYFGIYVITIMFEIAFVGGNRFSYRILRRIKQSKSLTMQDDDNRVLIVGSGSTASLIATEIKTHPKQHGHLIGFIDDDESKVGKSIAGIKVLGTRFDIIGLVKRKGINEIILAIPTASKECTKQILDECKRSGAKVKIIPGIMEVLDGRVSMSKIRDVEIEDLLGREPVDLNITEVSSYIKHKTVLVTGGGGSIGSELCRQIAKFEPTKLVILDIYENNAYDIQNELKRQYGKSLNLDVLIASVRDQKAVSRIMNELKPDVVFHAAAHKHVPLMERSPKEAIKNNVMGTLNVAEAAHEAGVERFVLISTDKAVNPTNVMGASKRLCEMVVQSLAQHSSTKFVAVRFGNVLGSNGSVIPLFKQQIKDGGPLTLTHKDIIRYFMTIPEASQLVIQAGAIAKGGEIFILDMGEPVKIYDLAEDLIRLSGLRPHEDVKIEITGLRPGEKLYEELLMSEEGMTNTKYSKIHIAAPTTLNYKMLRTSLDKFNQALETDSNQAIIERLAVLVPTFKTPEEVNSKVDHDLQAIVAAATPASSFVPALDQRIAH